MQNQEPQIDTLYQTYDRSLAKITGQETFDNIIDAVDSGGFAQANNSTMVSYPASSIGGGTNTSATNISGAIISGKTSFADYADAGFFLGVDIDGVVKLNLGNSTSYITWNGSALVVVGGVSVGSLNIPDTTTASSFHVDTSGNAWWGTNVATGYATAPASILATGVAQFTNMTITGGSVAASTLAGIVALANTNVAAQNWTQTSVFSASSATVVAWTSGTFTTAGGTNYSISSGNTGTMAAVTYIYLDIAVSTTAYQVTTTAATAVGTGKVLVAVAQNAATTATYLVESDQPAIVGNNIAANTITSGKISVSQLSAISADLGSITAGSITINGGVAAIDSSGNSTFKSIQVGGSTRQYTLNDSGIFSYGDGSDGDVTISTNTSLSRDMYYQNLTINSGAVVIPNGYRIFCSVSLTMSGNSSITMNGNNASGGTHGAALPAGYFTAAPAGNNPGGSVSNSLGGVGGGGGGGGGTLGPNHAGTSGASGGTATAARVKLIANWHLAAMLDISATGSTALFTGGSGGGNGGNGWGAGNGGSGGGAAGIVAIYSKILTIGSGCSITANGGNGSDAYPNNVNNGGGGGGGGAGGIIVLVYNSLSQGGSLTASGGTGGAGSVGGGPGGGFSVQYGGGGGTAGSTGAIYQFQISL